VKAAFGLAWAMLLVCGAAAWAGEIHEVAQRGDLQRAKTLLAGDPGLVDVKDEANGTALHLAAQAGHEELVRFLVEQGAQVDAGDNENSTPLDVAAQSGHRAVAELLVAHGADVNHRDQNGMTPLHFAAYQGRNDVVELLIANGSDVSATKLNGSTPLHGAVYYGHTETARLLIEKGAAIEAANESGYTPLISAAAGGRREPVELLLDRGADIAAVERYGNTALLIASHTGHVDVVELLLDRGAGLGPVATQGGWTALHSAVSRGHLNVAEALIAREADVNALTEGGSAPLHVAVHGGDPRIAELLIEHGADVNARDDGGATPLLWAARSGRGEMMELLIAKGGEVNTADNGGVMPLHCALLSGQPDQARLLLNKGAKVDARENRYGRTTLHWATIRGDRDFVDLLLGSGAEVNATDSDGLTPLHYAGRYGHKDVVDVLTDAGGAASDVEETYGPHPLLAETLSDGEAALWYLGHCGWAVRTRGHFLVFDYWNNGKDPVHAGLTNGHINPSDIADREVLVFVTHEHRDHYDPTIFAWEQTIDDITYVYGFRPEDLQENRESGYAGPAYEHMGPRETKMIGDVEITTVRANDAGVGFLVSVNDLSIYHAGDHAGWSEGAKRGFTDEIDYLAEHASDLDLAFLNMTGCHTHGPEPLWEGTLYTVDKLAPKVLIPTHAGEREYLYEEFAEKAGEAGFEPSVLYPENRGDSFLYRKGAIHRMVARQ
jgi:ankyrin repeat protein/L-ascorbate metabolism protein UlaG (beta-lactamase superfamily)